MVITAAAARGLAQRLAKAEALVADGAVMPVVDVAGVYAVRASDGASVHLVDTRIGRERCSCADYQQRQGPAGLSCKHLLATELLAERQAKPADRVTPELIEAGIAILTGKRPAA